MADKKFDLIVVGGGPGGYVAAIRAAQLGMKTALVEGQHLGGICLNWGCIPTKALLRTAEIYRNIQHADAYGIKVQGASVDLKKVIGRSRKVAAQLNAGVGHLLKKNKVEVIDGWGKLVRGTKGAQKLSVEKDGKKFADLTAAHIILATGARARSLPGLEPDGKLIWTYKEAMVPDVLPKSILVIGSGAIGIEFASFYCNLGVDVTVVEVMERVLPIEVKALKKLANSVTATIDKVGKSKDITVDRVILAVGIVGNVEDIGLEGTKVKVANGHIETNQWLETGEDGVFAIGDVTGPPWLAHKASHEGIICVEKIKGEKDVHPLNTLNIPGCTYCLPQVASVGLTEAKAKEAGYEVRVGRFPFMGNGKAIALGEPEGLVKTIFDAKTGELLGAHMIGTEVTELIQGYGIARTLETTEKELMHTIFPHPTLSEMMHESVLDAYGKVIHF
jgi:dihydrolipoamide dehydrogenase